MFVLWLVNNIAAYAQYLMGNSCVYYYKQNLTTLFRNAYGCKIIYMCILTMFVTIFWVLISCCLW